MTTLPDIDDPTGWKAAEALIGFIDDAPADIAEQHDHYLTAGRRCDLPRYGVPLLPRLEERRLPSGCRRLPNPQGSATCRSSAHHESRDRRNDHTDSEDRPRKGREAGTRE